MMSKCWRSLSTHSWSLKKIGFAFLFTFGSTYKCQQLLLPIKFIFNKNRNTLTTAVCVRLKTTNYKPHLTKLKSQVQDQGSH